MAADGEVAALRAEVAELRETTTNLIKVVEDLAAGLQIAAKVAAQADVRIDKLTKAVKQQRSSPLIFCH